MIKMKDWMERTIQACVTEDKNELKWTLNENRAVLLFVFFLGRQPNLHRHVYSAK